MNSFKVQSNVAITLRLCKAVEKSVSVGVFSWLWIKASPNLIDTTTVPKLGIWLISIFILRIPVGVSRVQVLVSPELMPGPPSMTPQSPVLSVLYPGFSCLVRRYYGWEGFFGHTRKCWLASWHCSRVRVNFLFSCWLHCNRAQTDFVLSNPSEKEILPWPMIDHDLSVTGRLELSWAWAGL